MFAALKDIFYPRIDKNDSWRVRRRQSNFCLTNLFFITWALVLSALFIDGAAERIQTSREVIYAVLAVYSLPIFTYHGAVLKDAISRLKGKSQ